MPLEMSLGLVIRQFRLNRLTFRILLDWKDLVQVLQVPVSEDFRVLVVVMEWFIPLYNTLNPVGY